MSRYHRYWKKKLVHQTANGYAMKTNVDVHKIEISIPIIKYGLLITLHRKKQSDKDKGDRCKTERKSLAKPF